MKLCKNFVLMLFCCLLTSLLIGCGKENISNQNNAITTVGYSVTDVTGTKLTFAEKPKRIISMSVGVDEILLDMYLIYSNRLKYLLAIREKNWCWQAVILT